MDGISCAKCSADIIDSVALVMRLNLTPSRVATMRKVIAAMLTSIFNLLFNQFPFINFSEMCRIELFANAHLSFTMFVLSIVFYYFSHKIHHVKLLFPENRQKSPLQ